MKTIKTQKVFAVLLCAFLFFLIPGCNLSEIKQNDSYVASVKSLVNNCINYNRTLKKQDESFDCHDPEKSKQFISTMDALADTFKDLLQLQPTDEFADYNNEICIRSGQALSCLTKLRTLAVYAYEHEDDTLFRNDKEIIYEEYNACCEQLRAMSSEVQTYWRNA